MLDRGVSFESMMGLPDRIWAALLVPVDRLPLPRCWHTCSPHAQICELTSVEATDAKFLPRSDLGHAR